MASVCRRRAQGFMRALFVGRNLDSNTSAARSRLDRGLDVGGDCDAFESQRSVHQVGARWNRTGTHGVRSSERNLDGFGRR